MNLSTAMRAPLLDNDVTTSSDVNLGSFRLANLDWYSLKPREVLRLGREIDSFAISSNWRHTNWIDNSKSRDLDIDYLSKKENLTGKLVNW